MNSALQQTASPTVRLLPPTAAVAGTVVAGTVVAGTVVAGTVVAGTAGRAGRAGSTVA
jgi:hypothetical protein